MAGRGVTGMAGAAIAAGTGGQRRQQIDLGEEFDEVAGPRRARLHEVPVRVARVAGAHEEVRHVVHVSLGFGQRQVPRRGQGAGEIRMAAVVVVATGQQVVGVGIAAGADHVVHAGAVLVDAVPVQGVAGDGGHGAEVWKAAPQPVAGADVGRVQGAGLAAVEPLREVVRVPQVQVADLWAVGVDDAKQMPRRDLERPSVPRRHGQRIHEGRAGADRLVEGPVPGRQLVHGVDGHRLHRPPGRRVRRLRMLRWNRHGSLLPILARAPESHPVLRGPDPYPKSRPVPEVPTRTPESRMLSTVERDAQGCTSVLSIQNRMSHCRCERRKIGDSPQGPGPDMVV